MEKDVKYWVDLSSYDLRTAGAMLKTGRYVYVLFMCQQAVEKLLKALVVKRTRSFPPKTHDLAAERRRSWHGCEKNSCKQ